MDNREKEAQLRRASERLYGDIRLRQGLPDEEAEQLLSWGFNQIEREAERASDYETEEATATIDAQVEAVRSTLKLVSQVATQLPEATEDQSREYLMKLVDALCEVDARSLRIDDMVAFEKLADRRGTLAPAEIAQQLLEILRTRNEAEGETGQIVTTSGQTESGEDAGEAALATSPAAIANEIGDRGEEEE